MHSRDYDMAKINANDIVFGLKITKFKPNENKCLYSNCYDPMAWQ